MLTVAEARSRILAALPAMADEPVDLDEAGGRVLAAPALATRQLPPHDNSAMDGFAVRCADLPGTLPIVGTIAAGAAPGATLEPGTVMRIMTGAPVPQGADGVVMREVVEDRGDAATFAEPCPSGQHIRGAGEDVTPGAEVLGAGVTLGPGEIAMLAAQGHATVRVARRPRVALLSTGDELVDVHVTPGPGQIVNSNAYALAVQVREAGGIPIHVGIAPDNRERLVEMMRSGLEADALFTSGGVSVGEFDYVKEAFAEAGVEMDFWRVAMKPGKPLAFGVSSSGTPVFGLPGNPVSSVVSFELFGRSALLAMQGARRVERPRVEVILGSRYEKNPGRAHFVRARLTRDGDALRAEPHPKQGSGMLSSMLEVDALVEVARDSGTVEPGTRLPAWLLRPV
jgi:molybdopterin molybdotransferase